MKLHFLLIHPTHYFGFLLKHLQNTIGNQIQVHFLEEVNKIYPWQSDFRQGYNSRVLKGSFLDKELIHNIFVEKDSVFILVGWDRLDKLFLIFLMGLLGRKFLIYTDTPNDYKERNKLLNFARNLVLRYVSITSRGMITTGQVGIQKISLWPYKFKNVFNLPFFVDVNYFKPARNSASINDKIIFFSSGRLLNSHKGFDLAIIALGELKRQNLLTSFSYLIAGEGPNRKEIEKLILENNLTSEVKLLGWIEPNMLLEHYQNSHIFLHPSYFDPYPNAVLEAMSCGLAIVASDKAGSAIDRITHGVSGYIFEAGNVNELMKNIILLANNRDFINKFGEAARENALKWPVSESEKIIKSILSLT